MRNFQNVVCIDDRYGKMMMLGLLNAPLTLSMHMMTPSNVIFKVKT